MFTMLQLVIFGMLISSAICTMDSQTKDWLLRLQKEFETNKKEMDKKIQLLQKENLELKSQISQPYCQTLSDDICGPCQCRDDDRLLKKYYCDCQNLQPKRNGLEFYQNGVKINGVYKVHQNILKIIQVYCDQTTDGGGWTVFQRKVDGSVNFYRDWVNYKHGFGQLQNEFWLGNENIFTMSLHGIYPRGNELRIDVKSSTGLYLYGKCKHFQVGNEKVFYQMNIGQYSGTLPGSSLAYHNGKKFSTFDSDNDGDNSNCAIVYKSGWWFGPAGCWDVNLNGQYHYDGKLDANNKWQGIHWVKYQSSQESLLFTEIKIRRTV